MDLQVHVEEDDGIRVDDISRGEKQVRKMQVPHMQQKGSITGTGRNAMPCQQSVPPKPGLTVTALNVRPYEKQQRTKTGNEIIATET